MKKKVFSLLGGVLLSLGTYASPNIDKIDPPFWYAGMQNPELQLMVYGEGIGDSRVTVDYPGVSLSSIVKLESDNYLLVYLKLDKDVQPGKIPLTFVQGKKKTVQEYELKARAMKGCEHKGFDASDALYAFAIAAEQREQENYMRTAELSTEQNYNMIDGQINNTPSVDELEEKAKRGEVISLSALAAAVKAEDGRTPQRDPDGKKPSIRAQLKADRAQSCKPQQREKEQEAKRSIRQALEME